MHIVNNQLVAIMVDSVPRDPALDDNVICHKMLFTRGMRITCLCKLESLSSEHCHGASSAFVRAIVDIDVEYFVPLRKQNVNFFLEGMRLLQQDDVKPVKVREQKLQFLLAFDKVPCQKCSAIPRGHSDGRLRSKNLCNRVFRSSELLVVSAWVGDQIENGLRSPPCRLTQ